MTLDALLLITAPRGMPRRKRRGVIGVAAGWRIVCPNGDELKSLVGLRYPKRDETQVRLLAERKLEQKAEA